MTTSLDTNKSDSLIRDEIVESSNSIRATTNTSNDGIGEFALLFRKLRFDFSSNDSLEITDDSWEWMRTDCGTDQVVCIV